MFNINILEDYLIDSTDKLNDQTIKIQLTIFNNFIKYKIPRTILGFKELSLNKDVKVRVNVINYKFIKQKYTFADGSTVIITPEIAKKYKLTYAIDVYVNINIYDNNKKIIKNAENICMGSIPIMVGSCECDNNLNKIAGIKEDYGGYFIIDGVEKILNKKNEL